MYGKQEFQECQIFLLQQFGKCAGESATEIQSEPLKRSKHVWDKHGK